MIENDAESPVTAQLHGWGRYPIRHARTLTPAGEDLRTVATTGKLIPRGLGRSYGDSAVAERVLSTRYLDNFLSFDAATGELTCEAGVSLGQILDVCVPRGWFLPVTPGTQFVTVGGAIASDVHGKNHHRAGSFSDHVTRMTVLLANGDTVTASPDEHPDLFRATASGMGLTGVITAATIRLLPIRSSLVTETTIKAPGLNAAIDALDAAEQSTYRVAWLDCVTRGRHFGRALVSLGEHAEEGPLAVRRGHGLRLPVDLPALLLNRYTIRAFNELYYRRVRGSRRTRTAPYEPYFYPLDAIGDWNRMYGKPGFVQYQFVVPQDGGRRALERILRRITESGRGSFLAVLKLLGPQNHNFLSFPLRGYTLALDFKVDRQVFELLDELDGMVLDAGGRVYLAKDARMSEAVFKVCYPAWEAFEEVRHRYGAVGRFRSDQSMRMGLS